MFVRGLFVGIFITLIVMIVMRIKRRS